MDSTIEAVIIKGGANGIGLAVAQTLAASGGWDIYLIDMDQQGGEAAAVSVPATFHMVDVHRSRRTAYENQFGDVTGRYHAIDRMSFQDVLLPGCDAMDIWVNTCSVLAGNEDYGARHR
ncbi:Uu.00g005920.m01.CDS01 [Anthostomella pinea]|uniref:Uu.00g005920.m01.CDS01 n=1 Tax=Anthostomella pinea TaxID=933095 RepID=A0AAI8VKX4_9PEZI|nr:Uu.00g005920.m01.CDS01 [Anthostomella pinea]